MSTTANPLAPTDASMPSGLSSEEAATRRSRSGPNRVKASRARPSVKRLRDSLTLPLVVLLLAVAAVYAALGELRDATVILTVIVAVVLIEIAIRWRANRAIAALSRLSAPRALVWRDGELQSLAPERLVCDDVILLTAGSRVPADARLIESERVLVDESMLTGEPQPVEHGVGKGQSPRLSAGTHVVRGRGIAIVTAVGKDSAMGRVASLVDRAQAPPAPLQRQIGDLARTLVVAALVTSAIVAVIAAVRGQPLQDVVLGGLTLAFATVPAELPVLAVVVLGLGSLRLARRGAIVRNLSAAETLGSMTLVCTDKTGTLTENRIGLIRVMTSAEVLDSPGNRPGDAGYVTRLARLASEPPAGEDARAGDPLDLAIFRASSTEWPDPMVRFAFDEGRRLASGLAQIEGQLLLGVKGAPEAVAVRSSGWRSERGVEPLDQEVRSRLIRVATELASGGARVLAVASRSFSGPPQGGPTWLEQDLILEGLLVFSDLLRPEVPHAIRRLHGAGVAVAMITGDQPATAEAVARPAGLSGPIFIAAQTRSWTDRELAKRAEVGSVFARARPEDKLRIVRAASAAGEIVAVTGDGVNDAPALEAAALGVAMGRGGSDVAREAADLVLTDDNFATLTGAVAEGRRLYENVRKAVRYYLAVKLALIAVSLAVAAAGRPLPFSPVQIVAIELFVEIGASIAFVNQSPEVDVMRRRPRSRRARLLDRSMLAWILAGGVTLAVLTGVVFMAALPALGVNGARTLVLGSWLAGHASLGIVMAWERRGSSLVHLFDNLPMVTWATVALACAIVVLAAPAVQGALHAGPVPLAAALLTVAASLLAPWWLELVKRTGLG